MQNKMHVQYTSYIVQDQKNYLIQNKSKATISLKMKIDKVLMPLDETSRKFVKLKISIKVN